MAKQIKYTIRFYSEWHCGSGLGAGADVDALVVKDRQNMPFVPGKTIKGLLREGVEELSLLPPDRINKLFGHVDANTHQMTEGCLYFTNASLSESESDAIINRGLREFLYNTKVSTAIDDEGVALDNTLRSIETVVPCDLFAAILDVPDEDVAVLKDAMRYVKRIGMNRNRGLGRCDFMDFKIEEI